MPTLPAAWSIEEQDARFVVRDHGGQALGLMSISRTSRGRSSSRALSNV